MYNLVKPIQVQEELQKRKLRIFTTREFAMVFQLNPYQAEYALAQHVKDRLLSRLKRGLYALKTNPPSDNEIANALYRPSYISFDYALSYYGIIPEVVYQISSATTKPTRLFTTDTLAFGYYTIKTQAYTGYMLRQDGERRFLIAEPEKALVDYLYILTMGKRGILGDRTVNDRLDITRLNPEKVREYAKLYEWKKLDELIEQVLRKEVAYDIR
jgi:predicted transcriptional regulator of viral defense system